MFKQLIAGIVTIGVLVGGAVAQSNPGDMPPLPPPLKIGDAAPALTDVKWLQGEPVSSYAPGQIYVLDFWATWCGPCRAAIPHMNEWHTKHQKDGVNIIGVAVWPRPNMVPTADFVKQKGADMAYRIAEDIDGKTSRAYMEAANQGGIPTVMIVDKAGKLAWIGHPMGGMDDVLKQIMAGTYDMASAAQKAAEQAKIDERNGKLESELRSAVKKKDFAQALKVADQMMAADPEGFAGVGFYKYRLLLVEMKDTAAAAAWGRQMIAGKPGEEPGMLNELAWYIVSDEQLKDADRDADLALEAAKKANDLTKNAEPAILDTLAHAHFLKGNVNEAVAASRRAVELADDAAMKAELKKSLEKFEKAANKG